MMQHWIDSGTSKGSAVASFAPNVHSAAPAVRLAALSFVHYSPDSGYCAVSKHWGAPLESGPATWEKPQIYPTMMKRKAQEIIAHANDMIDLSEHGRAAASFLAYGHRVKSELPRVWKKQVPKPQHHRAAWLHLHDSERALLALAFSSHVTDLWGYINEACAAYAQRGNITGYSSQVTDLLDAVCFGLWETGRFRV